MLGLIGACALRLELRAWARQGHRPQLWWRDDDAQAATPALARLMDIADESGAPLALAVVPVGLDPDLPELINRRSQVWVLQHGVDHLDAGAAARPSQFSPAATPSEVAHAIHKSGRRLRAFQRALPVYVPPWNDLQSNVAEALVLLGFEGVSGHGQFRSSRGLSRVDIHLDLMRWGARPRFRGTGRLLHRLTSLLRARRRQGCWAEPVGILTHHLDHDEAAWAFLRWMLTWQPLRTEADWLAIDAVFCSQARAAA